MIKSSTASIKFCNHNKLLILHKVIDEYRYVVSKFVDLLWNEENIPTLLPKETTSHIETWLYARMLQCAGKQASGIVRGTQVKQKRRLYVIDQLKEDKLYVKARKLQRIYDETSITKPNINQVCPELDS